MGLKRTREGDMAGPYVEMFAGFAKELDAVNEKRERLVQASRDVTRLSKKVIFALHRAKDGAFETNMARCEEDLAKIEAMIAKRIAAEVQTVDVFWRFHHAFSPGLQEYVEAVLFLQYTHKGTLADKAAVQSRIDAALTSSPPPHPSFLLPTSDYLLGVADLTGEVMRHALNSAASPRGSTTPLHAAHAFLGTLTPLCAQLPFGASSHEWRGKVEVMRGSAEKVERAAYRLRLREMEFGEGAGLGAGGVEHGLEEERRGGGRGEAVAERGL